MSTTFTKENTVPLLVNSVRLGQKMGAFLLKECSLLNKAIQYFNPEVKDKPTFDDAPDPEIVAINLLLQGVQKAQMHGGEHAYSVEDAALLWDIMEFWIKEGGKQVAANVNMGGPSKNKKSSKSAAASVRTVQNNEDDEESEEERDEIQPYVDSSKKGKGKGPA